ncbi:MAG: DNA-directed RNA polymerase subunit omega [Planctomycetota bacterium]
MDRRKVWELSRRCGGVFKFTVLLQKRIRELVKGAPKLVETSEVDLIKIALLEIEEGKIEMVPLSDDEIQAIEKAAQAEQALAPAEAQERKPLDPTAVVKELLSK